MSSWARHFMGSSYIITPDDVEVRRVPLTELNPDALRSFKRGQIASYVPPGDQVIIRP
jgi:hypothetical protein